MAYPNGSGYVVDLSDSKIAEFFEDEFGIDFEDPRYNANGLSKGKRLKTLVELEDAYTAAMVLRALWDRREGLIRRAGGPIHEAEDEEMRRQFLEIIADIESRSATPRMDALERYANNRTLDELIRDIERDLQANKPEAAMDHLHTYCMKKFAHLLKIRNISCSNDDALHARFGKYRRELLKEHNLNQFTERALKSAISLFDSFNDIRNHHSLAHDNPILEPAEARYVFDTISAMLIFLRALEAGRYGE